MKPTILIIYPDFATLEETALVAAAETGQFVELLGASYAVQRVDTAYDEEYASRVDAATARTITLELMRARLVEQPGATV